MGKDKDIKELTNLMSKALRHKIGSIVNENEIYANKYAKDAENIYERSRKGSAKTRVCKCQSEIGINFPPTFP